MHGTDLHESLARDRMRYERLLFARMGGTLTREDAEDIVSDALVKVAAKVEVDPPRPGNEEAWFARVVLNQGIDFIRARDGRKRNGSNGRPKVVPLREVHEDADALASDDDPAASIALGDAVEREQAQAVVTRVMSALDPKDAELVKLRHLVGPAASREQIATMAGLTVGEFRWRYTRAWNRFVDAVAGDAPTERCDHIRGLLGEVSAGVTSHDVVAEIDAHTLDCVSCRVFARESYRALELLPFAPVVTAAERWSARGLVVGAVEPGGRHRRRRGRGGGHPEPLRGRCRRPQGRDHRLQRDRRHGRPMRRRRRDPARPAGGQGREAEAARAGTHSFRDAGADTRRNARTKA
jgi:RNA polymerase sigma factor (sigma-70 family)